MKKRYLFLLFAMLSIIGYTQHTWNSSLFYTDVSGYIITKNGEKIEGKFEYKHPIDMQKGFRFDNNTYTPGQIRGFFLDGITWISKDYHGEELFMPTSFIGPITQYSFLRKDPYDELPISKNTKIDEVSMIQKLDDNPKEAALILLAFKKKMSEFVSDFEELSTKIANKEKGYRVLAFGKIIEEYNTWYKSNNPDYIHDFYKKE